MDKVGFEQPVSGRAGALECRHGAYGYRFRLPPHLAVPRDLVELAEDAPEVAVEWRHASATADVEELTATGLLIQSRGGSSIEIRSEPPGITLGLVEPPPPEGLVHPVLAVPISMLARWRGDLTVHAGAFEADGGAWAVVGRRAAGKSTTLALLGERGVPVVADDLLLVNDGIVWAGPNCVDLRPDAAPRFPRSRPIGEVGGRMRHRLSTPPSRPSLPLRGFFLLEWWDRPEVRLEPMRARDILGLMIEQEYIALLGLPDPEKLLDLAARPAWRVRRPQAWEAAGRAVDALLDAAGTA